MIMICRVFLKNVMQSDTFLNYWADWFLVYSKFLLP